MTDQPPSPLEYAARTERPLASTMRELARYLPLVAASLALLSALALPSHLVLSNAGGVAGNERGAVLSMARDSRAENWDLGPYTERVLPLGFHRVDWSHWRRDGRYLLVPKWVVVTVSSAALGVSIILLRRHRRPRDNQPLERTATARAGAVQ